MTAPDPLRAAALEQLERMRQACEAAKPDGQALIAALWHVARDHAPPWLRAAFFPRWQRILDADSLTLDEEFGRPWPSGTRRGSARLKRQANQRAHSAVWALVKADPSQPIDEWLFEQAGQTLSRERGRCVSARTVSRRYYAALEAGALDLARLKSATCQ